MADKEKQSFLKLLGIDAEKYSKIAVVGGGGKTSLLYRLTDELLSQKKKVILTTTTHMAYEPERPFALDGEPEKIKDLLEKEGYVIAAAYKPETEKFASLSRERLASLLEYDAVVLVEADGAKKKPIKVPEAWEPVIPSFAELVIGVAGLDCLYRPIKEVSHRAEQMSRFLGKSPEEEILPEDVRRIASSCEGLRKGCGKKAYRVYLNKADTLTETAIAKEITESLKKLNIEAAYGSLKEAERF